MIAKNVTVKDLKAALVAVNKKYKGNVTFNRFPEKSGRGFRFTLRVKDSKKPGHRLGFPSYKTEKQRRMTSACWHVHGDFFDALLDINPEAIIKTGLGNKNQIYSTGGEVSGNWEDYNIGSQYKPLFASEACECNW